MRRLGSLAILILLCGTLAADVLVLKDGTKVGGKIVTKDTHYEVTTEAGLRTYLKDEVEKVITNPKEILGDADQMFEEAKQEYQKSLNVSPAEQQSIAKSAVAKLSKARLAYAEARELFPEDKYADLDVKLMGIMQLMRLLRDRIGSEIARQPATGSPLPPPPPPPTPAPVVNPALPPKPPPPPRVVAPPEVAFATLMDPVKRADAPARAAAREGFQAWRSGAPDSYDLATAAILFLTRSDAEWKIDAATSKPLQDYFAKPWLKEPEKITPAAHLEAVNFLSEKISEVKKAGANAAAEALLIFAIGHLGHVAPGPELEKAAKTLGLSVTQSGIMGTAEGNVVRDLNGWIATGDYDVAYLAFIKEHRATDTPVVRFVWSWALLRMVHEKKHGYDRAAAALDTVKANEAPFRDHVAAFSKSIRAAAPCSSCGGLGKFRCTNCHGKKEQKWKCEACDGKGFIGDGFFNDVACNKCKKSGIAKMLICKKCPNGFIDCTKCQKKKEPPNIEDICYAAPCDACDGRGLAFKKISWPCKSCMGVGLKITPKSDPSKVLP